MSIRFMVGIASMARCALVVSGSVINASRRLSARRLDASSIEKSQLLPGAARARKKKPLRVTALTKSGRPGVEAATSSLESLLGPCGTRVFRRRQQKWDNAMRIHCLIYSQTSSDKRNESLDDGSHRPRWPSSGRERRWRVEATAVGPGAEHVNEGNRRRGTSTPFDQRESRHVRRVTAGWKSSTTLPEGSWRRICLPPG